MHTLQRDNPKQEHQSQEVLHNHRQHFKIYNKIKPMVESGLCEIIEYFLSGLNHDSNKKRSAETTQQLHKGFEDLFNGIGCFDGTFSLQLKPDIKPYQAPLRDVAYTFQKPFKWELERLQKQDILAPLGIDETSE